MTISLSQQSGTTEKLDDLTEKAIEQFRGKVRQSMYEGRTPFGRLELAREIEQESLAALRQRIRELVEEARREGYQSDKPFFMQPLPKLNND